MMINDVKTYLRNNEQLITDEMWATLIGQCSYSLKAELLETLSAAGVFEEVYPTISQNIKEYEDFVNNCAKKLGLPVKGQVVRNVELYRDAVTESLLDPKVFLQTVYIGYSLKLTSLPDAQFSLSYHTYMEVDITGTNYLDHVSTNALIPLTEILTNNLNSQTSHKLVENTLSALYSVVNEHQQQSNNSFTYTDDSVRYFSRC